MPGSYGVPKPSVPKSVKTGGRFITYLKLAAWTASSSKSAGNWSLPRPSSKHWSLAMNESSWKNRRSKKRLKHYSELKPLIPLTAWQYKNGRVEDGIWIPNPKPDKSSNVVTLTGRKDDSAH